MIRIGVEKAVRSRQYYVYTLSYPSAYFDTGRSGAFSHVFYVGKGIRHRVFHHEYEAEGDCACEKCQTIRFIWDHGHMAAITIRLLTPDEQVAFEYERALIAAIGLENLTNKAAGNRQFIRESEKLLTLDLRRARENAG